MGKIYHLDLKTLIETFEGQSGVLKREIPKGVANLKEPFLCSVYIERGQITRCMLTGNSGQLFDARNLLPVLYTLENWDVTFNVAPKKPLSPQPQEFSPRQTGMQTGTSPSFAPPSNEELLVPYHVAPVSTTQFNALQRKDRMLVQMVLVQIDGSRSVTEIKAQLALPADAVERALAILIQGEIIRVRKRDKP